MIRAIKNLHHSFFGYFQRILQGWFPGLLARLVFAGVLFVYFLHSAKIKVGDGFSGFFQIQDGAYAQILPKIMEKYDYDVTQIPDFPYQLIVYAGTYAEFILPILIVVGLFTRIAALGMICFIAVQTFVDITAHGADEKTIGAWFDRFPDSVISDQRMLWIFLLIYLFIYGAGKISLDALFDRRSKI